MEGLAEGDSGREDRRCREQAGEPAHRGPPPPARPALRAVDHAW